MVPHDGINGVEVLVCGCPEFGLDGSIRSGWSELSYYVVGEVVEGLGESGVLCREANLAQVVDHFEAYA